MAVGFPFFEHKWSNPNRGCIIPLSSIEGAIRFEYRSEYVLRNDAISIELRQPRRKWFLEMNNHGLIIRSFDAFHIILIRVATAHRVAIRHVHIIRENEVIRRYRLAIAPVYIVAQFYR